MHHHIIYINIDKACLQYQSRSFGTGAMETFHQVEWMLPEREETGRLRQTQTHVLYALAKLQQKTAE